jgi:hypothetical protein
MKNKILIVWVSTGDYTKRFPKFISTLNNFLPECDKWLAIFSDTELGWFRSYGKNVYSIKYYHPIDHEPWPFITLKKEFYILKAIEASYRLSYPQFVCYCNSNIEFRHEIECDEILKLDKISVCHNPAWWHEGCDPNKFTYGKPIDPKFKCAIEGYYEYLQAAFYIGPTELMKELSESQMEMMSYDLAHNRIPPFHDESYFNKWCHDNMNKINILPKEYLMDYDRKDLFECPDPKIVMTNSDDTQYEYKDKYFK